MDDKSSPGSYYNIEDEDFGNMNQVRTEIDPSMNNADDSTLYSIDDSDEIYAESSSEERDDDVSGEEEPLYALDDDEIDALNPSTLDFDRENAGSPFLSLLRIMFNPVNGWKSFKRYGYSSKRVGLGCFVPLVTLASLSPFLQYMYGAIMNLQNTFVASIVMFISFFFGYYAVVLLMDLFLPKKAAEKFRTPLGRNFVMMTMSTLAIFEFVYQAFPMIDPVLAFLPVWTLYLICRGIKIMRVAVSDEKQTMWTMCLLIIGLPIFCRWLFTELFIAGN